jgi:uncharacterized glyoxalase superfamily protein PhnB
MPSDLSRRHQLHGVQPVLSVADVGAAAAYFSSVLGFDVEFLHGEPPVHGRVKTGDGSYGQPIYIHLSRRGEDDVRLPGGELRIHVGAGLDALCDEYRRRGAEVAMAPTTQPWGLREFVLRAPDGHRLRFCAEA